MFKSIFLSLALLLASTFVMAAPPSSAPAPFNFNNQNIFGVPQQFGGYQAPNNGENIPSKVGVVLSPTNQSGTVFTSAAFNGTISGTTLTVNSLTSGTIAANQILDCFGCTADTIIISGSGTSWVVNNSQTVGPVAMSSGLYTGNSFNGYIVGTTLTTSSESTNGNIAVGQSVVGAGVNISTFIIGKVSAHVWTVNISQTVGSSGSPIAMISNAFDSGALDAPNIWWDPNEGLWEMAYTGWSNPVGDFTAIESIGLAQSRDLFAWTKVSETPVLTPTGNPGDPDDYGIAQAYIYYENGTYYAFYTGDTTQGVENGTKTMCLATTTTLPSAWVNTSWTRLGTIIGLGTVSTPSAWRSGAIYKPNIVKVGSTYYMFFNALGQAGFEQIGYATASNLLGPWTVQDANSPVLSVGAGGAWDNNKVGDPSLFQIGQTWNMGYFGFDGTHASDGFATTSTDPSSGFPLNWTKAANNPFLKAGVVRSLDSVYSHKPTLIQNGTSLFHFYVAVNTNTPPNRQIALAIHGANAPVAQKERVEVYNNANITISNSTKTTVPFNTLQEQQGPVSHWSSTTPTYVTIQKAGTYILSTRITWAGLGVGNRQVNISVNGNGFPNGSDVRDVSGTETISQTVTTRASLNVGDQVSVFVFQTSGGNLNIDFFSTLSPYLEVQEVGP